MTGLDMDLLVYLIYGHCRRSTPNQTPRSSLQVQRQRHHQRVFCCCQNSHVLLIKHESQTKRRYTESRDRDDLSNQGWGHGFEWGVEGKGEWTAGNLVNVEESWCPFTMEWAMMTSHTHYFPLSIPWMSIHRPHRVMSSIISQRQHNTR